MLCHCCFELNPAKERWCTLAKLLLPQKQHNLLAVGLDVDGVLRDTAYKAFCALCRTVEELGGTVPSFDHFIQGFESDALSYYRQCGVTETEKIKSVYYRHVGNHDETPPFADVHNFLLHLKNVEVKMFVVSSHPTQELRGWFSDHRINDHLLGIYGGSRDKRVCIRNACEQIGVDPQSACYIGDWGLDMRAAKFLGLLPIGITRGYASRLGLVASGAAHVIEHLSELSCCIK